MNEAVEQTSGAQASLWVRLALFTGPALLDSVAQSASGTIGTVWLGHLMGPYALGAATSFYPFLLLTIACSVGLANGAAIITGQHYGAGALERARDTMSAGLVMALLAGILTLVLGVPVTAPLLRFFHTPDALLSDAMAYGRLMLCCVPLLMLRIVLANELRRIGNSRIPLLMTLAEIPLIAASAPLLISGTFFTPAFGIRGAVLATGLGWGVPFFSVLFWMLISRHPLAPHAGLRKTLEVTRVLLLPVLSLGIPSMAEVSAMALAEAVLIGRINRFGPDMTAAYGIFTQTLTYVDFPGMTIGMTVSVFCAQAIGAQRRDEVFRVIRCGLLMALLVTGILALLVSVGGNWVAGMFTQDVAVIGLAVHAFRVVLWSSIFMALAGVLNAAMRASGNVVIPMGILLLAIFCIELPVGYMAADRFGAPGVWFGYPASFMSIFVLSGLYYALFWRHKPLDPLHGREPRSDA